MQTPVASRPARIKAARAWAGLSQYELAERLGVEVQWVKRRESGRQSAKQFELVAIAQACGLPVQWFYVDVPALLSRIPLEEPASAPVPDRIPPADARAQRQGA